MNSKLIPQNFKVIGIVLILISITFFSFNFFTSFEFEILNNVNLPITLPSMFPKVEGSSNGVNLNQRFFGILLILGLLFITTCKQEIENEKINEIRVNTFILVSKSKENMDYYMKDTIHTFATIGSKQFVYLS